MTDPNKKVRWYCLKSRTRQENIVRRRMEAETDIEVFCPLIRYERARATGKCRVTEAMFPGYIFARFCHMERHRQVQSVNGVSSIVAFGGVPAFVPDEVIRVLQAMVGDGEVVEVPDEVKVGEEVLVVEGPFSGVRALVSQILPGKERVKLLLEILGMEREVEFSCKAVMNENARMQNVPAAAAKVSRIPQGEPERR